MPSLSLPSLCAFALFAFSGAAAAQAPRAYWSFDQDYAALVGGPSFDGSPQGGVSIDAANARVGAGALRVDDGAGTVTYGALAVTTAQSSFTFSGTTSLGPIVGNPATFQLGGTLSCDVDRAQGPVGQAAFTGGDIFTVPSTISAYVQNPIIWLPPLATIQIQGAHFGIQSAPFSVQPGGAFAAQVVLTPTAGTVQITPLVGTPTTIQLASAGASNPTAVNGTLVVSAGSLRLTVPLNVTFQFDDGNGGTATITLVGSALAAQTLLPAPPAYVAVAGSAVTAGQSALSVSAWYRYSDLDALGSDASNSICAARSSFRLFLDTNRTQTRVNAQDTGGATRTAGDATAVDTQWHHAAFVYDAATSSLRLYVDGALRSSPATGGLGLQALAGFRIGQDYGALTTNFDGWLDEVAVFARVLSADEISALAARRTSPLALPFGRACGGLLAGSSGLPEIGTTFSLDVSGAPANAGGLLFLGVSRTTWLGLGLPFDLAALNAPGCDLNVSIDATSTAGANASGNASTSFSLPSDPTLVGAELFAQWAMASPQNALGLVWSQGLAVTVIG